MAAPPPNNNAVKLHSSPFSSTPSGSHESRVQDEYTYGDGEDDEEQPVPTTASVMSSAAAPGGVDHVDEDAVRIHPPRASQAAPPAEDRVYTDANGNEVREQVLSMPPEGIAAADATPGVLAPVHEDYGSGGLDVNYDPASATHAPADVETGSGSNHGRRTSLSDGLRIIVDDNPGALQVAQPGSYPHQAHDHETTLAEAPVKVVPTPVAPADKVAPIVPTAATAVNAHTLARAGSGSNDGLVYPYGSWMTYLLILTYLVLFIVEFGTAENGDGWKMEDWFINPSGGPSYEQLARLGAKSTFKIVGRINRSNGAAKAEGWRLLTSVFWHSGIVTFLPGMACLLWMGTQIEREYGPLRMGLLWFVSAVFGTCFSAVFCVDLLSVSATAGLFGLLGARLLDLYLYKDWFTFSYTALQAAGVVGAVGVGLVLGLLPLVDNWAHLGALAMGALVAGILFTGGWRQAPEPTAAHIRLEHLDVTRRYTKTRITCLILLAVAWAVVLGVLFGAVASNMTTKKRVTNVWCLGCDKFQCVDTNAWTCKPAYYN